MASSYFSWPIQNKCGRELAPDDGVSGNTCMTDTPPSGASRTVEPPLPQKPSRKCLFGVAECQAVIQHAVGEAPLIVVPGQYFQQFAAGLGVVGVEDRRQRVVVEVTGNQRQGVVAEDFRVLAGFLEQRVDFLGRGVFF